MLFDEEPRLGEARLLQKLVDLGVVRKLKNGLRVLGNGDVTRKLTVKAHHFSKAAEEKITAAGGTVEKIEA